MSAGARYFGIDLAWGTRARTGLAVLDDAGRLVESGSVRTDDDISAFIGRHAGDPVTAAIDAPLIVPNPIGRRPCEALVSQVFGRYNAGAYPANSSNPLFGPQPRGARLASTFGWTLDPGVVPSPGTSVAIEVYPHPAMVSLFSLETVIPYKAKPGRDFSSLQQAYDVLLGHVETTCGPVLHLGSSARWTQIRVIASAATRTYQLAAIEDEIDAIVCAYLAWLWANARDTMVVHGDYRTGYIVTPLPPAAAVLSDQAVARAGELG